ncbi:hypothetical protein [Marinobacterium rhizophilum]|uniref:Uncharacterized protein n=1 Tax=Marinobacterium rhizophilum TaxID=420402 RepID=A0ABY5HNP5_9GAMM|nr:hypothetical protein [Marinobacterium rhizophilum]UTW14040.1 hypothetical protein KDW95_10555 [Marinobacterium rhizophilum]
MQIGTSFRLPAPRKALKRRAVQRSTCVDEPVREGEWEPGAGSAGPAAGRQRDAQADARFAALDYHSQRALLAYDATQSRGAAGQLEPACIDLFI